MGPKFVNEPFTIACAGVACASNAKRITAKGIAAPMCFILMFVSLGSDPKIYISFNHSIPFIEE